MLLLYWVPKEDQGGHCGCCFSVNEETENLRGCDLSKVTQLVGGRSGTQLNVPYVL